MAPYRLTQTGLEWYTQNRVLNRQRTSSQKYARCIWEVVLGRLALSAADAKTLFDIFIVDGRSPWYSEEEVNAQIAQLLEMEYITLAASADLDAICSARLAGESKAVKASGRNWKVRNEKLKRIEDLTLARFREWFRRNPDWPPRT